MCENLLLNDVNDIFQLRYKLIVGILIDLDFDTYVILLVFSYNLGSKSWRIIT